MQKEKSHNKWLIRKSEESKRIAYAYHLLNIGKLYGA